MPIVSLDLTTPPGQIVFGCANCGHPRLVLLNRGAMEIGQWTRGVGVRALWTLVNGDTLTIDIDGTPTPISFATADFVDISNIPTAELASVLGAKLGAGVTVTVPASGYILIESATTGAGSSVSFSAGSALAALNLDLNYLCNSPGRPVLGYVIGGTTNYDFVVLRKCPCFAAEGVMRTFDTADPSYAGTFFYEQRRVVNALSEHFKANGWVEPTLAAYYAAETTIPVDVNPDIVSAPITLPTA